jgi:hypothetical protein
VYRSAREGIEYLMGRVVGLGGFLLNIHPLYALVGWMGCPILCECCSQIRWIPIKYSVNGLVSRMGSVVGLGGYQSNIHTGYKLVSQTWHQILYRLCCRIPWISINMYTLAGKTTY